MLIYSCQKCDFLKSIANFYGFSYTKCNRVARSLFGIGNQAEPCTQLFYVKEQIYGLEETIDLSSDYKEGTTFDTLFRRELKIFPIPKMARKLKAHSIMSRWSSQKTKKKK
jgi:hypothetical protein